MDGTSVKKVVDFNWKLRVIMEMCSESGYGVVNGVGGHMEYLRDGIRPESQDEDILSESESESESGKVVKKGVPLQSQDEDISLESESESGKVAEKGVPLQRCNRCIYLRAENFVLSAPFHC